MHRPRTSLRRTAVIAAALLAAPLLLTGPAAQAVSGVPETDTSHAFTARLDIGDGTRSCSAVLVDAQWLLTASTCFASDPSDPTSLKAGAPTFTTTATIGRTDLTGTAGQVRKVTQLVPRSDRDLTLARLDKPVTDITPVQIATSPPEAGSSVSVAGYGRTKTEWSPLKLHTATFASSAVQGSDLPLTGQDGAAVCAGDTGGPAMTGSGATLRLVGINSRSFQGGCWGTDPAETRTGAVDTRVDDLADWIAKNRLATMHADVTDLITTADFNNDGRPDVAAILKDGNIHAFYTTPDGTLVYGRELWKHDGSWSRKTRIFGGDFNGDGNADIAAINVDGNLSLYPGTATGQLGSPLSMWKDATWGSFPSIATYRAKGWTRDGLITVAPTGRLWAYPTAANGVLDGSRSEAWNDDSWNKKLIASSDFNGDSLNDVAAIAQSGQLDLYTGTSTGKFKYGNAMWSDPTWGSFPVLMGGDYNGDGKADIAAVNSSGGLYLYPGDGNGKLSARSSMWPTIG
ncbi:trypsin-like serine protease [Streptomyces sp. NPDC052051]|uniref:trypsin-like serine protease n=1 Tax=Streptomyces sp. NPDC052051 TaxID=3154649 RepID=UPI0034254CB3